MSVRFVSWGRKEDGGADTVTSFGGSDSSDPSTCRSGYQRIPCNQILHELLLEGEGELSESDGRQESIPEPQDFWVQFEVESKLLLPYSLTLSWNFLMVSL